MEKSPAGTALAQALRGVKQDGNFHLTPVVQDDLLSMVPSARRGEECATLARVATEGQGLRDRGDGAVLIAEITNCKGGSIYAFAAGNPPRVARLLDVGEAETVHGAKTLNLRGGKRDDELGLELLTGPTSSELRIFSRRDTGFAYSEAGALREFVALRECGQSQAKDDAEGRGWTSLLKVDGKNRLSVLRLDEACAGGPWQASCQLFTLEQGALGKSGVCALPAKLDVKSLKALGWR